MAREHAYTAVLHEYTVISLPLIYTTKKKKTKSCSPPKWECLVRCEAPLPLAENTELLLADKTKCSPATYRLKTSFIVACNERAYCANALRVDSSNSSLAKKYYMCSCSFLIGIISGSLDNIRGPRNSWGFEARKGSFPGFSGEDNWYIGHISCLALKLRHGLVRNLHYYPSF